MSDKVDTKSVELDISADHKVTVMLTLDVIAGYKGAVGNMAKAYGYFSDNAVKICAQFWGFNEEDAKEHRDDVLGRKGDSYDALYQFGVINHPEYPKWQGLVIKAEAKKGTDEGSTLKDAADGLINRIRNVANQSRSRVIVYFAKKTSNEQEAGERNDKGARSLIEGFIADMQKRLDKGRGAFALEAEKRLARDAIFAMRQVLGQSNLAANPQLILGTPPVAEKRTIGAADRANGPVVDRTAEFKAAEAAAGEATV